MEDLTLGHLCAVTKAYQYTRACEHAMEHMRHLGGLYDKVHQKDVPHTAHHTLSWNTYLLLAFGWLVTLVTLVTLCLENICIKVDMAQSLGLAS